MAVRGQRGGGVVFVAWWEGKGGREKREEGHERAGVVEGREGRWARGWACSASHP